MLNISKVKRSVSRFLSNRIVEGFLLTLILLNILAFILESDKYLFSVAKGYFFYFEIFSISVFTIEYLLRLFTIRKIASFFRPLLLLDLIVILPFYLSFMTTDLRFLRAFRIVRVFRILKVARYVTSVRKLYKIFASKKEELLITCLFLMISVIVASSLMYLVEGNEQEAFSSIPNAMWWCVVTFTTVGYGDTYPVTPLGKILAAIVAILGIALYGILTSILGSAFLDEIEKNKPKKQ